MQIRSRVFASAALALAVIVCCAALLGIGATRSRAADAEQELVQAASRAIAGLLTLTYEYALHAEARAAEQWRQQHAGLVATLAAPVQSGETSAARFELRDTAAQLPTLFHRLTELGAQPDAGLAGRSRGLLIDQLLARTQALADSAYRWSREAAAAEQAARRWLRLGGVAGLLLLLATVLAQPIVVWRRVLRPLSVLEGAAAAVEQGNLAARCESTARDELGRVSRRFDAMTAALGERSAELLRSEIRLRAIADNVPALITQIDADQRYTFVNAYIERVLGVPPESLTGRSMREICGAALYAEVAPHVQSALRGDRAAFETRFAVGEMLRHYQSNYIPEFADDGSVRGFYGISFDVTERKESEMRQAASEQRLRMITDNLPVLIAYIDHEQRYQFCNATHEQWFGVPASRVQGQLVADILGELYAERRPHIERALAGERVESEQMFLQPGGERHVHALYLPHRKNGVTLGFYALVTDVTTIKRNEAELKRLARNDSLTGLPNRRQFDERLGEAMARARRTRECLALLFLDIDRFKAVNDSLGHAAGDAVLKEFAHRLKDNVRTTDSVARLAGDEFVVVLEGIHNAAEAEQVTHKIVLAMRRAFMIDGKARSVTTSVGIALFEGDATLPDELMACADAALYDAKGAGRDGFRLGRPTHLARAM